jgi:glycosyltransferase A (GT-A) superfamily protein (DUF2064 family)
MMGADKVALVLFAKEPRLGENKTRLAELIGKGSALQLYRAMAEDVWSTMKSVGSPCVLSSNTESPWLPEPDHVIKQPDGNFGKRINVVFEQLHELGYEGVVALGADTPHLRKQMIEMAVYNLSIGIELATCPSDDGGLVILAMSLPSKVDLEAMPFETDKLDEALTEAGKSIKSSRILPGSYDIDNFNDIVRLFKEDTETRFVCKRTYNVLRQNYSLIFPDLSPPG